MDVPLVNNGVKMIEGVVGEFQKLINKLERGKTLCMVQKEKNEDKVSTLTQKNVVLNKSVETANKLIKNIGALIEV